jgi:hypothetical protein
MLQFSGNIFSRNFVVTDLQVKTYSQFFIPQQGTFAVFCFPKIKTFELKFLNCPLKHCFFITNGLFLHTGQTPTSHPSPPK